MSKVLPVTPLYALVTATALIVLASCGAPTNQNAPNSAAPTAAASQTKNRSNSDEACRDNLLIKALPPQNAIGDLPFERWDCSFNTASAYYGTNGGKEVEVTLNDTRSPNINTQPAAMHDFYTHMGETVRQSAKFTVETAVGTRKETPGVPGALDAIGGPDYLPVVENTATGEPLVIQVGAKGDHVPAQAEALIKDRYALTIGAKDKDGQITGLSGPQAQALFDPFLKQMHLDALPGL
jgi:hypothetical protein